jgi:hypothetical protein
MHVIRLHNCIVLVMGKTENEGQKVCRRMCSVCPDRRATIDFIVRWFWFTNYDGPGMLAAAAINTGPI